MENPLKRLFKKTTQEPPPQLERAELIGGGTASFTPWGGNAYANDIYRGAVDAIARNAAKLKGSHVVKYPDKKTKMGTDAKLDRLLQISPNPAINAYDMLYRVITLYFLYNNAFIYLARDEAGHVAGLYPLCPAHMDFLQSGAELYCRFSFTGGKSAIIPYADVVHLRRHYSTNELCGIENTALEPALQLAHTQNEGIINGIKSGAVLRAILKRNQLAGEGLLSEIANNFKKDYLSIENSGGVAVLDAKTDYIPLEQKPYTIDDGQLQATRRKIHDYLGVSEKIVNSSYDENEWAAFYESTIEPLAVQLSLEFTRKVFNERERAFGNEIMFESGRLQFSSNQTKVNLIKELVPFGLLTINQAMEILNLPAVEDGDRRFQTLNVVDTKQAQQYQLGKAGIKTPTEDKSDEGNTDS